jgi:squalene-hopene/tetraprenyl-beta-curcumene cyclase
MMKIAGLAYVVAETTDLNRWKTYAQEVLGMMTSTAPDGGSRRNSASTSSQTAWALLALLAAGEADNPAVARGAAYLLRCQTEAGEWDEDDYSGTGFPRVFYLRYHGYRRIFPLWALARLRNLQMRNSRQVSFGL